MLFVRCVWLLACFKGLILFLFASCFLFRRDGSAAFWYRGQATCHAGPKIFKTTHSYWLYPKIRAIYRARYKRTSDLHDAHWPRGRDRPKIRLDCHVRASSSCSRSSTAAGAAVLGHLNISDEVSLETLRRGSSVRRSTNSINQQRAPLKISFSSYVPQR